MKRYKVIQCPSCGSVQSSEASETFKCYSCGKSKKMNPKSKLGLAVKVLASFDVAADAVKFVQSYKKSLWEKQNESK